MKVYDYRQVVVAERDVRSDTTERLLNRWGAEGFRLRCVERVTRLMRIEDEERSPAVLYVLEREREQAPDEEARRAEVFPGGELPLGADQTRSGS